MWRRSLFVGYAQSGLRADATMVAPQFLGVGENEAITLESLAPTGDDASDNVNIRVLDAYGRTIEGQDYTWNDWNYSEPCWVDSNYEKVEGVVFKQGQGLWVYGSSASQALQSAGKVGKEDAVVKLRADATPTGNPFPVDIPLQDIVAEGENCSDNVNIRILDAYGRTVEGCDYTWNDWNYSEPCWVDSNYEKIENVTIPAGQGLWVYGSSDKQFLRFPAPEL